MILLTLFHLTIVFELLFFLLWAFPNWANLPATKVLNSELKKSDLLDGRSTSGSCHAQDKCGLCTNTTNEGGIIESPNFPSEYAPDLNCLYEIQAPLGGQIRLTFTDFVVEKCCDFITVFDGENDPFELRLNGYDIPEAITSSSSQIKVKFTTNSNNTLPFIINSTTNTGSAHRWQARYKFLVDDKNLVSQLDTVVSTNLTSSIV